MVLDQLSQQREQNWQSLWNRGLVSLYIILYFLDGVTRYKHIVSALLFITAVVYLYKYKADFFVTLKNNITLATLIFVASVVYGIAISFDVHYSIGKAGNAVFEKVIAIALSIAVVLHKESAKDIARTFIYALIVAILPLAVADAWQYLEEYKNGHLPLTTFNHKYKSDAVIFMMPALLFLWKSKHKLVFTALALILGLIIIGTMQRGTWLAIALTSCLWAIINREWKLPLLAVVIFSLFVAVGHQKSPEHFTKFFSKLQQTDSSNRYGNGTQGSALDLIKENPIKGYGYGDEIFYRVYNDRVDDYPQWIARVSIGPHNLTLAAWFAGGIFGLAALWYLLISVGKACVSGYKRTDDVVKAAWLTLGLILAGDFFVRGAFETVNISNLGVLLGIALALRAKQKQV